MQNNYSFPNDGYQNDQIISFLKNTKKITDFFSISADGNNLELDITKLPTDEPETAGILWNNGGIISISQ